MAANLNLGKLAFSFKDEWDENVPYYPLEVVKYGDSLWYAPVEIAAYGDAPDAHPAWILMLKGYASDINPTPNTIPLRDPVTGAIKAGDPSAAEDVVTLEVLDRFADSNALSGNLLDLVASGAIPPLRRYWTQPSTPGNPPATHAFNVYWKWLNYGVLKILYAEKDEVSFNNTYTVSSNTWGGWKRVDSGGAFTSEDYILLPVPPHNAYVVMPFDGYLTLSGFAGGLGSYIAMAITGMAKHMTAFGPDMYMDVFFPAVQGRYVVIQHENVNNINLVAVKSIGSLVV